MKYSLNKVINDKSCCFVQQQCQQKINNEYKDTHPEIDWREIVDLRNRLAHQYFQVDADSIETMIEERLRELFQLVNMIFE